MFSFLQSGRKSPRHSQNARKKGNARLSLEALEDRVVPVHWQVLETPAVSLVGDALDRSSGPVAGGSDVVRYTADARAGLTRSFHEYVTFLNHTTQGSFTIDGALTVLVLPDPELGERAGDLVRIDLSIDYGVRAWALGRTPPNGASQNVVGSEIGLEVSDPGGAPVAGAGQGILFSDYAVRRDDNQTSFSHSELKQWTIEARIGDKISLPTSMTGSAEYQGSSFFSMLTTPDLRR